MSVPPPTAHIDLILITGSDSAAQIERRTREALSVEGSHRIAVQLRSKHLASDERQALAQALRELTRARFAALFVNGDLELALSVGADGLHLSADGPAPHSLRERWNARAIAMACHDAAALERAARDGADLALLSPVHSVQGKNPPLGLERFAALVRNARLPVYALGGLDAGNVAAVIGCGAAGAAVIRAVYDAPSPATAADDLLRAIERARGAPAYQT